MNKLKEWDASKNWKNTGIANNKIEEFENTHGVSFPKAYKEYLNISGKYCPAIVQGHGFEYEEDQQKLAKRLLKDYNLNGLIKKPFWVIADFEPAFWYFHLDEGDNPPVYKLDCENYEDFQDEYTFGKVADSFQAWIESAIDNYEETKEYRE